MNKIIVANMKMNLNIEEISNYLKKINANVNSENVVFCPTSIYLPYFLKNNYKIGIQNIYSKNSGAYTGEVSPSQAASLGIHYALIGHSERRLYFKEDDILIKDKVLEAIKNNLKVILCIGETLEEKNLLKTTKVLKRQIVNVIRELDREMLDNLIIAYEPVWAIGSGLIPTNDDIEKISEYIKMVVNDTKGYLDIDVLYGGSVNEKNIDELNKLKNISGFLIGGASNDPEKIIDIINKTIDK